MRNLLSIILLNLVVLGVQAISSHDNFQSSFDRDVHYFGWRRRCVPSIVGKLKNIFLYVLPKILNQLISFEIKLIPILYLISHQFNSKERFNEQGSQEKQWEKSQEHQ